MALNHNLAFLGESLSGKSYTLIGKPTDAGILLRFMGHLFLRLDEVRKKELIKTYIPNSLEEIHSF